MTIVATHTTATTSMMIVRSTGGPSSPLVSEASGTYAWGGDGIRVSFAVSSVTLWFTDSSSISVLTGSVNSGIVTVPTSSNSFTSSGISYMEGGCSSTASPGQRSGFVV